MEQRFTEIYKGNLWGGAESVSGPGSSVDYTENLRAALPLLFEQFSIASVFDAPCGDFHWMKHVLNGDSPDYVGGDIVKPMIEALQAQFANPKIRFVYIDLTKERYPSADLMICRDLLIHLSYDDTRHVLRNFLDSGIKYLLTTTHMNMTGFENHDIETGGFRLIDLFAPPYEFPYDVRFRVLDWKPPFRGKEMCLWDRKQIAALPFLA